MLDFGARNYSADLGRWSNIDPAADVLESSSPYVYALNSPTIYIDMDGELPIVINGKVSSDSERKAEKYWSAEIIATIQGSGIANPGGQIHYVDGDQYNVSNPRLGLDYNKNGKTIGAGNTASRRVRAGYTSADADFSSILSKLERDPESGKIIEKIQIYTHSRGAAFGVGYTKRLLELISKNADQFSDPSNVIDYVLNLAPHQSNSLDSPKGVDAYSIDRGYDMLSGNDMGGLNGAFKSNAESGKPGASHRIKTFQNDLSSFISAFSESNGNNDKLINSFVEKMKEHGVNVTVK